jgi:hypothetical protein
MRPSTCSCGVALAVVLEMAPSRYAVLPGVRVRVGEKQIVSLSASFVPEHARMHKKSKGSQGKRT